jgi:hypothetical protein
MAAMFPGGLAPQGSTRQGIDPITGKPRTEYLQHSFNPQAETQKWEQYWSPNQTEKNIFSDILGSFF